MGIMVQVRNVPESLHEELKRRADLRGLTLTAYIQGILERAVGTMELSEWLDRALDFEPIEVDEAIVDTIRREREERTDQLTSVRNRR